MFDVWDTMAGSGTGALAGRSAAGGGRGAQPSLPELDLRALPEPMPEAMLPPGAELEGVDCPDADGAGGGGERAASGEAFALAWWSGGAFALAFAAIALVGAGGNALVLWIVAGHKVMRTPTNLFLLNLAVSDVINCVLNFPFVVLYHLDGLHWPFGAAYCHVQQFLGNCVLPAIVFTFMAIALDRCAALVARLSRAIQLTYIELHNTRLLPMLDYSHQIPAASDKSKWHMHESVAPAHALLMKRQHARRYVAIIYPLRPRMTWRRTFALVGLIWFISVLIAAPAGFYAETRAGAGGRVVCRIQWPEWPAHDTPATAAPASALPQLPEWELHEPFPALPKPAQRTTAISTSLPLLSKTRSR